MLGAVVISASQRMVAWVRVVVKFVRSDVLFWIYFESRAGRICSWVRCVGCESEFFGLSQLKEGIALY